MDDNLKEIFKNQWKQINNASINKRPHHSQVKDILNKYDFDCFIDCGVGYVGTESWSINDLAPNTTIIGFEPHNERRWKK